MTGGTASGAIEVWLVDLVHAAPLEATLRRLGLMSTLPAASHDPVRRLAHGALRVLIARHLGIDAARRPFVQAASGKPGIADAGRAFAFSLAHSGAHAIIALASAGEVGVDIEGPRRLQMSEARRDALVRAAASLAEPAIPGATVEERSLQAWVRLEAVAKATGEGIGAVLERLGARPGHAAPSVTVARAGLGGVVDLALPDRLHGALAWTAPALRAVGAGVRVFPMSAAALMALVQTPPDA